MGTRTKNPLFGYLPRLPARRHRVGEARLRLYRQVPVRISRKSHNTDWRWTTEATSTEFDGDTKQPLIIFMPEISKTHMGGTMRLGLRPTVFEAGSEKWSKVRQLYGGAEKIWERHRHRYEVNPEYLEKLSESGLSFVGKDEKGERMQVLELPGAETLPNHILFHFKSHYAFRD